MYVPDSVMLPISYVIENPTSVNYKQTTANFRRISYIRYRPFELKTERGKPEFALHLMEKFDNIDCDARCNRHNRKAFAPQCKEYRYDKTRGGTQPPVSCIEDCRNRHCGQNCIRNVCEKRAHEAVVDFLL